MRRARVIADDIVRESYYATQAGMLYNWVKVVENIQNDALDAAAKIACDIAEEEMGVIDEASNPDRAEQFEYGAEVARHITLGIRALKPAGREASDESR